MSLVLAACMFSATCPCGSDPNDPVSEHDPTFVGKHTVEDECVCYCGDDPPFGLVKDRECADYNGSCTDEHGQEQQLSCE